MREPIIVPELDWPALVLSVWYVKPGEAVVDARGYGPVCLVGSLMPLAAYGVLRWTESRTESPIESR